MNDSLFLPHPQAPDGGRALSGWECCWMPLGEGEAEGLHSGRSGRWQHVEVPAQQAAVAERSAIWYRTRFSRPDYAGRILLRFGGAFLAANVWLNGRLLGSHYGYFAPFGFDVTPYLKPENTLVVCCESPVETDLAAKRHLLRWFGDGDARPYPAGAFFSLPEPYRWEVPLGLWRPVELEFVDGVVVDWLRLRPRLEADVGRLEVTARLRNLDGREMQGEVAVAVSGAGAEPVRLRREYRVGGGLEQTVSMTVSVPHARRWSPWRFGPAELYAVEAAELLGNRPSVVAWVAHDDPPWTSAGADLADVHTVRQNHTVDHEAKALFEEIDPSRRALAGSGDTDAHLYAGWRGSGWEALHEAEPHFASEFGAQALPPAGSP